MKRRIYFYIGAPLISLVVFLFVFLKFGPLGLFQTTVVPLEDAFIQRVVFKPEQITVTVFNNGAEPVTIVQALINDAYWQFTMEPSRTLQPRERAVINMYYPWLSGDPQHISLLSRNGTTFDKEIEAAAITPQLQADYIQAFILLGLYVGVIPVLLGLMWLPLLKRLHEKWYGLLISLTVGLLIFLGVDALFEAFELIQEVPTALNGSGIFLIGFLLSILVLSAVSHKTEHLFDTDHEHTQALIWGYLIALGIGLHNLGEGLAIGSAYAIGAVALGSSLVIGFMLHNITEGIAIVAPLTKTIKNIRQDVHHVVLMGIIAGVPTIIGSLIGGFSYTTEFALLFLAIGAGAIFDVAFDIIHSIKKGSWLSLFKVTHVIGFLAGLFIMYLTGFFVTG